MKKLIKSIVLVSFCFALASCANDLNENNPEDCSTLASLAGVKYGDSSSSSSSSGSSSKSWAYDSVSGTFYSGSDEAIYYFESISGKNEYTLEWTNSVSGKSEVSISQYPSFSSCTVEDDSTGSHTIAVDGKLKVYIRIRPKDQRTYNAGSYELQVSGYVGSINLYRYY